MNTGDWLSFREAPARERSLSPVHLSRQDSDLSPVPHITDGQQVQKLSKEQRDVILAALLKRHAGVRQLQRLTGIGKNIISNVSKKYISRQDSDLSPVPIGRIQSGTGVYHVMMRGITTITLSRQVN